MTLGHPLKSSCAGNKRLLIMIKRLTLTTSEKMLFTLGENEMKRSTRPNWVRWLACTVFVCVLSARANDFADLRGSLVIVETDVGNGSGFVVEIGGKRYVMTNQHVVRAAKKIQLRLVDGQQLIPKGLEIAAELDAVRITFDSASYETRPLSLVSTQPTIGNSIKIFGNSEGMGAITELAGKILGVGPDIIEVDAGFVRGNSGSPILDQTGKVIGIATFITLNTPDTDWVLKGTRFISTRRFGVRLTDSIKWTKVTFDDFYQQTKLLDDTSRYLSAVFAVMCCWFDGNSKAQARRDLFTYASSENQTLCGHVQWETRFKDFVKAYKAYWKVRAHTSAQSMTAQGARITLLRQFEKMPFDPQSELQKTKWLTPALAKESENALDVMTLFQKEIQKMTKDDGRFWHNNILHSSGHY